MFDAGRDEGFAELDRDAEADLGDSVSQAKKGVGLMRNAAFLTALVVLLLARASAQRVTEGIVVLYDFDEGDGELVEDSGPDEPVDLVIQDPDNVIWEDGYLTVVEPGTVIQGETAPKLYEALTDSNALTVEAWIRPAFVGQSGPARIVAYSDPFSDLCNVMIGQDDTEFHARLRTSATGNKGRPRRLKTFDIAVTDELTHLVYVFDGDSGQAAFWVDGEERMLEVGGNYVAGDVGGNFTDPGNGHDGWDETYTFGLANEDGQLNRVFLGDYHLVAVYDRALSADEIDQNYEAGPDPETEPQPPAGPTFVRGDANSDGNIDITDGVAILGYLFGGEVSLACLDAANTTDSGTLNLTDAVNIFSWLFQSGQAPPPPSPSDANYPPADCGPDPTEDDLDCAEPAETCSP